jgi:hypothetical protein
MFNDTRLQQSGVDGAEADSPAEGPHGANASPPRFSRLALCVTAASALTLGVVGTAAYGVWFNHDQQAYAEAIAKARQSLGRSAVSAGLPVKQVVSGDQRMPAEPGSTTATEAALPTSDGDRGQSDQQLEEGSQQAVWSGQVARAPAAEIAPAGPTGAGLTTPATSAVPASSAPSLHSTRRTTGQSDSSASKFATSRTVKDTHAGQQQRRTTAADARQSARQNARHQSNLFARMGLFFRRVSYRQHGGASQQQDLYSHP